MNFEFCLKTADLAARLLLSGAHDLNQGGVFGSFFYRKFVYIVNYGAKVNLSAKSCSDISDLEDN